MIEYRMTTVDNPYDPFTEWDDWYMYDLQQGYNTCGRIASITSISDQLSNAENNEAILDSMKQIQKTGAFNKKGEIVEYKIIKKDIKY